MAIKHAKQSGLPADEGNSSHVEPTDWYADHVIYTLPTVRGVGSSASGTGDITPGLPASTAEFDILLLFVQTSNQLVTAPAGYTQLTPHVGLGTAASAGSIGGVVFWKRATSSESDPTVTDPGDHAVAQIMGIENCARDGNPFLNIGMRRKPTASTTGTATAGATPVDNCLVVNAFFHALDSASAVFSSFTNSNLGSVTEQIDVATADGTGGGIGVCTGTMAKAGSFAATTVTETSTSDMALTFILLPLGIMHRHGFIDRQIFTRTGDTWTKPTGARLITVTAIGGGASGSAGRSAATAAGGGGGGGGMWREATHDASHFGSTATVTVGAGGAATANTDGAASNAGTASTTTGIFAQLGGAAGSSASGSGGTGGNGGGFGNATAAGTQAFGSQPTGGGTGGTTALAGGAGQDFSGGSGAGGGTTQATSAGGSSQRGGGGGGGGRSNTNVGTGGAGSGGSFAGGSTAGAAGTDSTLTTIGGGGGAGGTSAAGPGGSGGWPGGGGGGGGSQSGAQRGGAGADGCVTIITLC